MYAEKQPTNLKPEIFLEELTYMRNGRKFGLSEVKGNVAILYRMQLAFEPAVSYYTESVWSKYPYLGERMGKDDFVDYARDYVLGILCWKLNTEELISVGMNLLPDCIMAQVVGRFRYLPLRLGQENPILTDLECSDEYLSDDSQVSPEDHLIAKEEWEEFFQKVSVLSKDCQMIISRLMAGEDVSSADKKSILDLGKEVFGFSGSARSDPKDNGNILKPKFGLVDRDGLSVFLNLSPGQALWLIGKLTPKQQVAVFCKLKYLKESAVKMDSKNLSHLLADAKSSLLRMRSCINNVPLFLGNLGSYLDGLILDEGHQKAQNFGYGKNLHIVQARCWESGFMDGLSPRKRLVAEMVYSGCSINNIAETLKVSAGKVYSDLYEMAGRSTS